METHDKITVPEAIETFTSIMRSLRTVDQQTFLLFIADNWKPEEIKVQSLSQVMCNKECKPQEDQLNSIKDIVTEIKDRVPFSGILSSEKIVPPAVGENSDCDNKSTKHVDAFLYDDIDVDVLIEEGQLDTLYCADCGSNNIKECNIISHSLSVPDMLYIFHVLPSLEGKTLLDVGSRLGAVLYGAHIFTSAKKIIGVEMNKEFCTLQSDIITKYNMNDRIEIVHQRIEECADIVRKSDTIIMNNPFEFYVSESVHAEIWKFLKANIQSGTFLVTRPPIETTLNNLNIGISINDWVEPYEPKGAKIPRLFGSLPVYPAQHADIKFYKVL